MRRRLATTLALVAALAGAVAVPVSNATRAPALKLAPGWRAVLVAEAPAILFPTAVVAAPDGTVYLGQDPMDMPGPPTSPGDSVVAVKGGNVSVFADGLWAVMGLEWADGTLYVVHAPFLSAFRDTDGDGRADSRVDLVTGLGPDVPGFNGINDHVASGLRLGTDGYLYLSVGDKGLPRAVGSDGASVRLRGGGVVRVRPDGTGLEIVSTGERNPLSVALDEDDEVFTFGNDDDDKRWPNSLTHHVVGGHYGYPYEFLDAPGRALPIVDGRVGGAGAQGVCYNDDGLAPRFRGNLFFCDWGLAALTRYELARSGGTFRVKEKEYIVRRGTVGDFRPFSVAVGDGGRSLYLVDWAFNGFLVDGPKTGRLYRLTYEGPDRVEPSPRPAGSGLASELSALDHPSHSVRLRAQRALSARGAEAEGPLAAKLGAQGPAAGRRHALWALDAIGTESSRRAVRGVLADPDPRLRTHAARSAGIRRDRRAMPALLVLLRDPDPVARREAAVALGRLGDPSAAPALFDALGDPDRFAAWTVRKAIRDLNAWDPDALALALRDPARREDALRLCDESWSVHAVRALAGALAAPGDPAWRVRVASTLAGQYRRYPEWTGQWFGPNPLAGEFPRKSVDWDPSGMSAVFEGLSCALDDPAPPVRRASIAGLLEVGARALPRLRVAFARETDPANLAALAGALGALGDNASAPALARKLLDPAAPPAVRSAALGALQGLDAAESRNARLALARDPSAPAALVAEALPALGRDGVLNADDLTRFLGHASAPVRASALRALTPRDAASAPVRVAAVARLGDSSPEVRRDAAGAAATLGLRESIPALSRLLADGGSCRTEALRALAAMPDPSVLPVYLDALNDRDPGVRRLAESALLAVRDAVAADLASRARSGTLTGPAALAVERVLARFRPVTDWRVIGPFPKNTPPLFAGPSPIDFTKSQTGALGRPVAWNARKGDAETGRVVLDDFKGGTGDRGGFGYDALGSPDLAAFACAEVVSDRDRPALLLVGSSGTVTVTVNGATAFHAEHASGRPYDSDSDLVRVSLKRGTNRVLVRTRQGIGRWSFGVRLSDESAPVSAAPTAPGPSHREALRSYALTHPGDPRRGESLFFDADGVGCVRCHAAGGRGSARVGPDLTGLALKYDTAEVVRSVLDPSDRVVSGYRPVLVAKTDGTVVTGLLRGETEAHLELIDADGVPSRVPQSEVEARHLSDVSLMPAGLVDALTPPEFADLIAYLRSLTSSGPPTP